MRTSNTSVASPTQCESENDGRSGVSSPDAISGIKVGPSMEPEELVRILDGTFTQSVCR